MRKICFLLSVFFFGQLCAKEIVVVIASYNNKDWYERNLDSVLCQDYTHFSVIYTDDASPDGTGNLVEAYLKSHPQGHRVTLIKNEKRCGALANQYCAIHSCEDEAIIVIVDGDDFLADETVLSYIAKVYEDKNVWLTYGQFECCPTEKPGFCCAIPDYVVKNNSFRNSSDRYIPAHLRTFYAGLFKNIELKDLLYKGDFLRSSGDIAAMYPMIEMARKGHFKFIAKILYFYNVSNPIMDYKVDLGLQNKMARIIRRRRSYPALEGL